MNENERGVNAVSNKQTETAQPDCLVPDAQFRREMGNISEMTLGRWDLDPRMHALGMPTKVQIRSRNFRSRHAIEAFKTRVMAEAAQRRKLLLARRASKPQSDKAAPKRAARGRRSRTAMVAAE